jgi:7-cyano-7-deazaguanine tRNA-ribosyltransferase
LWEHLELRTHGHPALFQALKKLGKYKKFIEKHSPIVGRKGLFFYNSVGLIRPEIVRYRERLKERYSPPENTKILLLISQPKTRPFHKSREFKKAVKLLQNSLGEEMNETHFCFYAAPFGIIPIELDEVYPLSQNEVALPLDIETIEYVANQVANYIQRTSYSRIVFLHDQEKWNKTVLRACKKVCLEKNIKFECLNQKEGKKNSGF